MPAANAGQQKWPDYSPGQHTTACNTFLPVRNNFVYSCSMKICASGLDKLLESIFCLLLVVEVFSPQKIIEMLEEMVVGW